MSANIYEKVRKNTLTTVNTEQQLGQVDKVHQASSSLLIVYATFLCLTAKAQYRDHLRKDNHHHSQSPLFVVLASLLLFPVKPLYKACLEQIKMIKAI